MDTKLSSRLANLFQIDETELLISIEKGKDILSAISELTGVPRQNVKLIAHGLMYSSGPDNLKQGIGGNRTS